ncbi:beta-glucosidase [Enterococcus sp. AZ194]|uniref:glycoside hydrolase family 3 N-terminal domain-containing protein n=1 Tax=Enterococcus sp. AZ194 TaxID=2774629 RepID=UPI003F28C854
MNAQELHELLGEMTIEEKIGQLVQLTPDYYSESGEITGPMAFWEYSHKERNRAGSVLGTRNAEQVIQIQKAYLDKSRLKVPLLFMADVIHGYETIFPIPLALAASFNPEVVELAAALSAKEASEAGIQVTFSPMVDHVKDARWGRVMESNGEDPVLSSALARAYVRGYQGQNLAQDFTKIAACLKHFVGYGASEAGRDYNHVDLSDRELYQNYLPAFRAAIEEGAQLVMTSFNSIKGVPSTGNSAVVKDILRKELEFSGVVISDWSSVSELVAHRVAENRQEAARMAFDATVDIEMVSDCYQHYLANQLTEEDVTQLNQAVFRVLTLKNRLGLFEDPYRGLLSIKKNESSFTASKELRQQAKEVAHKTIVLLKNDTHILPLKKNKRIALVGSKATSCDILGGWAYNGKFEEAIPLNQGLKEKDLQLTVVGSKTQTISEMEKRAMLEAAATNDVVVVALGETSQEIGENKSKASPTLPSEQIDLIKELAEVNPNLVLVLFNGRPFVLTEIDTQVKAIIEAWFPGSEGGRALADILVGEVNPQAKLPMSFPRAVGQLPLSYQLYSTGRPMTRESEDKPYVTRYVDVKNSPLYPFGYGLSYTMFEYNQLSQSSDILTNEEPVTISVKIKNTGSMKGTEIVQLYLEDCVTQVVRPMRELKQWREVELQPNEEKEVQFTIYSTELCYVHNDLTNVADFGTFDYWIGSDSTADLAGKFVYKESRSEKAVD